MRKLRAEVEQLRSDLSDKSDQLTSSQDSLKREKEQFTALQEARNLLVIDLEALRAAMKEAQNNWHAKEQSLQSLLSESHQQQQTLQFQLKSLQAQHSSLESENQSLKASVDLSRSQLQQSRSETQEAHR